MLFRAGAVFVFVANSVCLMLFRAGAVFVFVANKPCVLDAVQAQPPAPPAAAPEPLGAAHEYAAIDRETMVEEEEDVQINQVRLLPVLGRSSACLMHLRDAVALMERGRLDMGRDKKDV